MDQADATIEAAKIAAHAARISAIIGALGTSSAVIGASIAAAVTYFNIRRQLQGPEGDRRDAQVAAKAALKSSLKSTIATVENVLSTYRTDFGTPVELSILPLPEALTNYDRKEVSFLGGEVLDSIGMVEVRLADYRRAKQPIQHSRRSSSGKLPVVLNDRPDGFDAVIDAAKDYRGALVELRDQLV